MLLRFCLYGFLKNLRLFEAFLVLALLERGHDFLAIGTLVAVREVVVHVLEIPSGALADALGRKRCMVLSFVAYVLAYVLLGVAHGWWLLAGAMALVGFGDAFRSGTHKALIYAWLRAQGREGERTRVYGFTRSWSKRGSAVSALLGGLLLFSGAPYDWVFYASALPALLNLVNLATYPAALDERRAGGGSSLAGVWSALKDGLAHTALSRDLRGLARQSAAVEGGYAVIKDYVQPLLQATAIALPLATGVAVDRRTGLVVGLVGCVLYLVASAASRRAHAFEERTGGPEASARRIGLLMTAAYATLLVGLLAGWYPVAILVFVALAGLQNLWRPIQVSRFDRCTDPELSATVLSIEAQLRSTAVAIGAPVIGAVLDWTGYDAEGASIRGLWPVPAFALVLLALGFVAGARRPVRG